MFLKDKDQCNLTDPESRLMRKNKRSGELEADNAQAIVDAEGSQLIRGAYVSQSPSDRNELYDDPPLVESLQAQLPALYHHKGSFPLSGCMWRT